MDTQVHNTELGIEWINYLRMSNVCLYALLDDPKTGVEEELTIVRENTGALSQQCTDLMIASQHIVGNNKMNNDLQEQLKV